MKTYYGYCKNCIYRNTDRCDLCSTRKDGKPICFEEIDTKKHLKGYIFDSLVYRYQLALEQRVEVLARQYINSGRFSNKIEAEAFVRQHENKRDLMAFMRILNEAIGEHD